jgi:hypothetical protein
MFRTRYLLGALALVVAAGLALCYEGSSAKDSLRACRGGACDYTDFEYSVPHVQCGWGLTNHCGPCQFNGTAWYCVGLESGPYCSQCGPADGGTVWYYGYDDYFNFTTLRDGSTPCTDQFRPGCKVTVEDGAQQCTCLKPTTADLVGQCTINNLVRCSGL